MIQIMHLPMGPLQTNCYVVVCEKTMRAAVIDPAWEGRAIAATADGEGFQITHILITHSHFDHVGGLGQLKEATGAKIYMHPEAVETLQGAELASNLFRMSIPPVPPADVMISEGEVITVGQLKFHVLFTPGHAPGHVSFYMPDFNVIFSGDVLFQQGIGRTDLPGGDAALLMKSIKEKLLTLPDETHVLSGHGNPTTVGAEKKSNPFLRE